MIPAIVLSFILLFVLTTLIGACLMDSEGGWAGLLSLLLVVLFALAPRHEILDAMTSTSVLYAAGCLAGYAALGVAWATVKWVMFTRGQSIKLQAWLRENPHFQEWKANTPPDAPQTYFKTFEYRTLPLPHVHYDVKAKTFSVLASKHRGRITKWISLWPLNIVYTLIEDLLLELWARLYDLVAGTFQRISDRMFADVNK